MGFGSGSWLGFVGVAALIALAAAGGEIILLPLAVVAAVAAVVWYIVFRAMGVERAPVEGATAMTSAGVRSRSAQAAELELHVNKLGDGELPGGAEGGDDSPSAHRIALPSRDGTPWGDTDQHSSSARVLAGTTSDH